MLCCLYGDEGLKEIQSRILFVKFHPEDFSLKDEQRSVWASEADDDEIKALIESDLHETVREIEIA